jgi:hypothetical protein
MVIYTYKCRPGYGSNKLLIEISKGAEQEIFVCDLSNALKELNLKIKGFQDLWMKDEFIVKATSDIGEFTISKDIWNIAFINADENQKIINIIDTILSMNPIFKKEEVDFNNYKL